MSINWISAQGRLQITSDTIRVILHRDFVDYYIWHIKRASWNLIEVAPPMHGAHITILNPKHHAKPEALRLFRLARNNNLINFEYSLDMQTGGQSKGFTNFWLPVRSREIEDIKKAFDIRDGSGYLGLHLTIGSNKSHLNNRKQS